MPTIIAKVQENVDTLHMTPKTELAFVSGETVKSQVIRANALVNRIVLNVPAFSGAVVTATLSIENPDSEEIYSKGSLVEDERHVIITEVPIIGDNTFKVTLDTDPLSSGSCYLSVYMKGV